MLRGRDQEDVMQARQHEHAQRVVDHRLVVYREQLLGLDAAHGVEPGGGAASQDDASHAADLSRSCVLYPCSQLRQVGPCGRRPRCGALENRTIRWTLSTRADTSTAWTRVMHP